LKGLPNCLKELKYFDESLYKQLINLKTIKDLEGLDLFFSINEKDSGKEVELIKNGKNIQVTKENLVRYLYYYADYKMNIQVKNQFKEFKIGFNKSINIDFLKIFSE